MARYEFDVEEMCCGSCEDAIRQSAREIDGVTGLNADSDTDTVKVTVDDASEETVRDSIGDAGFTVVG